MTRLHELHDAGQAVWLDYIRRAFIESGELQELIDLGVTGITSNPSIFEKAIAGSADYDEALRPLIAAGTSAEEIYEALALEDIRRAADLLRPVYDLTAGEHGWVSYEVSPHLAGNTAETIAAARRLFAALDRPNVMIKVPATPAGIPAIEQLTGEGLNVNITLMFSLRHYDAVAEAYLRGLEKLAADGGDLRQVASVASFFLSRVDTAVDKALDEAGNHALQGQIAVANAKVTYQRFLETFSGERWERLAAQGARVQRVLWASTSTKDPAYPDTMYVDNLIGPHTVNTMPRSTINAFLDHGTVRVTITEGVEEARRQLAELAELGIDLDEITERLQREGVDKFSTAFERLLDGVAQKREEMQLDRPRFTYHLEELAEPVTAARQEMRDERILERIWRHDHTVWQEDPAEISNRLGWLHAPEMMSDCLERPQRLAANVRAAGYRQVLLLGMGGSSLAPELFANVFGNGSSDGLKLAVLDSTDPDAVRAYAERFDPAATLYIVATKSGGTVETLSFFKYFYNRVLEAVGEAEAGRHFVAITDPGSKLEKLAQEYNFRATFLNDPNVGGRYSALTYFGLVPAVLVGVDVAELLERAQSAACNAEACNGFEKGDNVSAQLGAILGEAALAGRDKVTFLTSPALANFGDWVEQLIAESTGKSGRGILPVVGETPGDPGVYGSDRFFVYLRLDGDDTHDAAYERLLQAGFPGVRFALRDLYDLGEQFFIWEMATAVAGYRLGINPFDQPNVESAKVRANEMVAAYRESGELPRGEIAPRSPAALHDFLDQARPGDYIALQAFVRPELQTEQALQTLRHALRARYHLATTLGYGPRFLHSTGQLHKGDAGNGLFVQFTSDAEQDLPIPDTAGSDDSSITFGVLKMAQALGDAQALRDNNRRLIRFHLGHEVVSALQQLTAERD